MWLKYMLNMSDVICLYEVKCLRASINQQCGKLEPLLFESHGVAETNFFPPKVSRVMFSYGKIHALLPCILSCYIMRL